MARGRSGNLKLERQGSLCVFEHRLPHEYCLDSNTGPPSPQPVIPGEPPNDATYRRLEELCHTFPSMQAILNGAYFCGIFYREELAGSIFHTRVWIGLPRKITTLVTQRS